MTESPIKTVKDAAEYLGIRFDPSAGVFHNELFQAMINKLFVLEERIKELEKQKT